MSASDASATNSDAAPTAGPKTGIMPLPSEKTHDMVYCCRKCRTPLFRPDAIGEHDVGKHHFSYLRTQKDREQGKGSRSFAGDGGAPTEPSCTSYFLKEALKWMESASSDVEGKLLCPHCSARVGTLNWSGAQCSCEFHWLQRATCRNISTHNQTPPLSSLPTWRIRPCPRPRASTCALLSLLAPTTAPPVAACAVGSARTRRRHVGIACHPGHQEVRG